MPSSPPPQVTPVIVGPTASGKSDLSVAVARTLRESHGLEAEIVTADAYQVYRGMDIGTAKPSVAERAGIPHHLIDIVDPHGDVSFTVEDWLAAANAAMTDIRARGAMPIVVGGTSLYVQSLLHGLFEGPQADPALRAQLNALSREELRRELTSVDPAAAERIHPNDTRRSVRAIEVFRLTGRPISAQQTQWNAGSIDEGPGHAFRLFILSWPTEELNRRINTRVKSMMDRGLLDEVRLLLSRGPLNTQAREALGYKQLIAHLNDPRMPLEDAVEKIKIETRRFGKNQRTWMRRLATTSGAMTLGAAGLPLAEHAERVAMVASGN